MKHKVLIDYPHISKSSKITTIPKGTILVDYVTDGVKINSEIVENNPEYFAEVDWRQELKIHFKSNKIKIPAAATVKSIEQFIEEQFIDGSVIISNADFELLQEKTSVKDVQKILNKYI